MNENKQSPNAKNIIPTSTISDCNTLVLVRTQKRRLSEICDSAALSILAAQKCSAEAALREAQITSERDLKRARMENRTLESEKAELISQSKTLERRLTESTDANDALRRRLQLVQSEANERVESILKAFKQEENLTEVIFYQYILLRNLIN